MFDQFFDAVASLLNFFYELVPNYAFAIAMLTLVIMIVTTPLTLKSTRSMLQMQRLQPEMRRIQQKYKDDRQKMNEELMAFYQEHGINPLGGCLPMVLQMPVFLILFRVIRGITHRSGGADGPFTPQHLKPGQKLYDALAGKREMVSFGIDLAKSASKVMSESFVSAIPYLILVALVGVMSFYTQRQIQGRATTDIPGPQKALTRVFTVMFVFIAFVSPAALVIYFVVSSTWRVLQQAYITRSLYSGDDSPGAQAAQAMKELRKQKEAGGSGSKLLGDSAPRLGRGDRGGAARDGADKAGDDPAKGDKGTGTNGKAPRGKAQAGPQNRDRDDGPAPTARTASRPHPRSRKKKKRR